MIDATMLTEGLYIGSAPAPGPMLSQEGLDTLVLVAAQNQAEGSYPGVEVLAHPFLDQVPTAAERQVARQLARAIAERVEAGKSVLITCMRGRSRASWIGALTLVQLGASPADAVRTVQAARQAFDNQAMVSDVLSG